MGGCGALRRPAARALTWLAAAMPLGALALLAACAQPGSTQRADDASTTPAASACTPAPLGATALYLRGSMNQWAADDPSEFLYRCNAYELNITLQGEQRFKVADEAWTDPHIFANPPGRNQPGLPARLAVGPNTSELVHRFDGTPQTLRLVFDGPGFMPRLAFTPGHFVDSRRAPLTDPVALGLRHDSRALSDKSPFGAVPAGTAVRFSFSAPPGVQSATLVIERRQLVGDQTQLNYEPVARVLMQRSPAEAADAPGQERFSASHRFADVGVHGYHFQVQIGGQTYLLQNNTDTIHWTREKGSNGMAQAARLDQLGDGPAATRKIRRLRLSVYTPGFQTPDWAADAVYYYIFPERFRNGDPSNDPRPGSRRYQDQPVERHSRWLEAPFKPGSGDGSDAVYNNDFFGGDLAGILEKLDDIRDLGANTLYLTPIFHGASNHKYDTADYRRIDPGFGSHADFTRLTDAARKRGIRVVIDTSFNHTGSDSVYFDRFNNFSGGGNLGAFAGGSIQANSPWASWYRFNPAASPPALPYTGWANVADLPELDKSSPAWREFAYRAPDSITRLWLQRGASGWRMDVAPWVPDDFWREWRGVVKATDPQAITIAETWFEASKHLLGDMFDSTMNYIFRNAVMAYANGGAASALATQLELMRELYPPPAHQALMNLLSTHDAARALHVFGQTSASSDAATVRLAQQRLKLAVLFQMSYPGAPAIYYGDEVGLTGGDDPYNRAPYPWADQGGQPDLALRAEFKRLVALRQQHPVLRRGSLLAPLLVDGPVLVLARQLGEGPGARWAVNGFNSGDVERQVTVRLPAEWAARAADVATEPLTGARQALAGGQLSLRLPPLGGSVWLGP